MRCCVTGTSRTSAASEPKPLRSLPPRVRTVCGPSRSSRRWWSLSRTGWRSRCCRCRLKLSLKAVAAALEVPKAAMADPAAAQRATGYVLGGISPFGQRKALPTVVDASALGLDRVLCSAGQRGWDVAVAPADLIRLTGAITADLQAH